MRTVILVIGLCVLLVRSTILPISDGGTNSAAMLTNGKIAYSTLGAIMEAMPLKSSDGKSIIIGETYASISPASPVKLNLIGMNNNNSGSPGIATYSSADNYPLIQTLPYAHDDLSINFDMYWDLVGYWRSSHSGSQFQIWKYLNSLMFNYGSPVAQGSPVDPSTAFSLEKNGTVTFQRPIRLTASGTSTADLYHYSEGVYNATVYRYATQGSTIARNALVGYTDTGDYKLIYNVYAQIRFVRINNIVTASIAPFLVKTDNQLYWDSSTLSWKALPVARVDIGIAVDLSTIPSQYRPIYGINTYTLSNVSIIQGPRSKSLVLDEGSIVGMGSVNTLASIIASNTTSSAGSKPEFFIKPEGRTTFMLSNFTIGMPMGAVITYEVDPVYA